MSITCRRGHPQNPTNTRVRKHKGRSDTRVCRVCATILANLRYRKNDEWRERIKAKNLNRYHAQKEQTV